jgi:nucleotide-binding universal stress UspA family protein
MTMHLVRECPCPIWVVKKGHAEPYGRVLAAVDPWPDYEASKELNQRILDLATSLAELEHSELHVVHAWHLFAESVLRGRAEIPDAEVDRMTREARGHCRTKLDELLAPYRLNPDRSEVHLVKGRPEEVVPRLVRSKKVDLVIMGSGRHGFLDGFLFSNATEKILSRVTCSVLITKPGSFETSVRLED